MHKLGQSPRAEVPVANLLDDLRFTLRQLRRSRGFLVITVITLTLAIAANAVVYGIANTLLLRPLPVQEPQQLVEVQNPGLLGVAFSYPNYLDVQQRTRQTFSSAALARLTRMSLNLHRDAEPVWGYMVSGNYFSTLGLVPQLGSFIQPSDDVSENGSAVIVLSDSCWRGRFHADPQIVGKSVLVGKIPFTVLGVAPRGFRGTERFILPEVWLPYHDGPEVDGAGGFDRRGSTNAEVYARLRPGVTRAEADADLRRVSAQMAQEYPKEDQGTAWHTAPVGLMGEALGTPVRAFIAGVASLALLVFLAACANLSVLFSSRTAERARELGIRLALGSTRRRILRQLMLESVLIAAVGGAIASLCARWLLHLVSGWQPSTGLPAQLFAEADWRVYALSATLSLLTGLFFGVLPARQVWRTDPNRTLRSAMATGAADRGWFRSGMLLAQIALCCLLVTASAVALRGLQQMENVPLGFDPRGVTLAIADVKLAGYSGEAAVVAQQHLLNAIQRIPGVTSAAYANDQPLSLNANTRDVYLPGATNFDHAHVAATPLDFYVSPGYFATTETRLVAGREFTQRDDTHAPTVAIVNQTLARRLFGTENAVGRHFPMGTGEAPVLTEVVGVTEDGKYLSLSEEGTPALFVPMLQNHDSTAVLFVRSDRGSAEMAQAMRAAVASVDPSIPIFNATSWSDALSIVTFPARAATLALGVLGGLAAMLAVTGIFGVASYTVSRRMREFGIRTALGAGMFDVLRAALGKTMLLIASGSALGLLIGVASGKLMSAVVYHASAADPLVLLAALLMMVALGIAATLVPARRALSVTPAELLREQ